MKKKKVARRVICKKFCLNFKTHVNVLGNLFFKTSSVAKTKKFSIDSIAVVSFCVLRYDCYIQTTTWHGFNICFPRKNEKFAKVVYVIFGMVFN